MFTPIKGFGGLSDTLLNTPQPQASSTVRRRSPLDNRFNDKHSMNKTQDEQNITYEEVAQNEKESSLGLLHDISLRTNMSTIESEPKLNYPHTDATLERARKLVQRCSDTRNSFLTTETNKENNANVQNLTSNLAVSNFNLPNEVGILESNHESNINRLTNEVMGTNVTFDPNEITARSSPSDDDNSVKKQSVLSKTFNGINFSMEDIMAQANNEMIAQLNNEEFLSGSKIAEQLSVDEAHWQQDRTFCMPVMNTEKQKLNLSSFSGIMGHLDLTSESRVGEKLSIGQYFERKSADIGMLDNEQVRPNFELTSETSTKRGNLEPLIESINFTDATLSTESKEETFVSNATRDIDERSLISLSTILNTLQNVNSGTPRRLVDQILLAQKKKNSPVKKNDITQEIYALPSDRKSMLATTTGNSNKFDEDVLENLSTKLSLDSRTNCTTKNEMTSETVKNEPISVKQECSRMLSFASNKNMNTVESLTNAYEGKIVKKEENKNATCSFNQNAEASDATLILQNSKLSNEKFMLLSHVLSKKDLKNYDESYNDLNIQRKKMIENDISYNNIMDPSLSINISAEMQPNLNSVVIGKNTERLCNCIIGITSEVNIELRNDGDKWITYSLELNDVHGDMQSIELNIPEYEHLIEPNGTHSTMIKVKVTQMCKQIFVGLNIILSDMVAKSKWCLKHMICVNPEHLNLDIICDSPKLELDFQYITINSTKILPIIFHNKNSIDVPIKLFILHDGPKIFNIDGIFDKSIKLNDSHVEITHLILKSHEKFKANIKCELQSTLIGKFQDQSQYWKGKLIIRVQCSDGNILFQKEVPLYAQKGTCKIQIVDTEVPIIVPRQQSKLLHIINTGNVATHVSATIVSIEGYPNSAHNFSIEPADIFLQVEERNSFSILYKPQVSANSLDNNSCAKVKLVADNNVYFYIINTEQKLESENYLRCQTPSNVVSLSPAISPQSVTSNRSGLCDRNSPISTVSSLAVAGNTIPIKSTQSALVWNSVKTGKNETKEFTIRNTSENKIKIQIDIWDDKNSFKFLGDRQTSTTSMVLAMHRQELKTLAVIFSPYHTGPVTGKITIKHYIRDDSDSQQCKRIPLYGYGGYSKIKILNIFKDVSGKMGLSFGSLYSGTTVLTTEITLQNTGDLHSFAKIKVIPKVISPTMDSNWHINPKELILNPKETRRVKIEFSPKKEDFARLQRSEVSQVATINITWGDEPTRWRIRRLYNKIKESENENEAFKNIVHPICKPFPGEQLIPGLFSIRDSVQNLNDLCTGVHQYEIMLTVEACTDDTLPLHYDADESQMYHSLSEITHVDEAGGASFFASQTMAEHETQHSRLPEQFTVTPSTVVLNPPLQNEATVTIFSLLKRDEPFQTNVSNSNYIRVIPAVGMLQSKKNFPLKIQCSQRIERNMQALLEIFTENNKQEVFIKVVKRQ
ncbi:LOW QUALITY PROTEIN: uncharacterized protein LOC114937540 [Nylanderia fulva]|uniref:LOW QUALITY PROTEIN: uncharacterized protein LOC114937540 n=1 Tax=Nylanderia fulva TaxID=613905 RepID=UPI0010FBAD03|nr:LOW QUALITY PROTEIN: uncharacterized protein LOC114937540 [Nylanderia fulva]